MSFTYALRIYFGIWPAVTFKFRADQIVPGGFLSRVNVWFCLRQTQAPDYIGQKLTEHEVTAGAAPNISISSTQSPLTFPHRRSITLLPNLSVTAIFLRPQTGVKKETPPGGAGV